MKLDCTVEINYRLQPNTRRKPIKSILSLGKYPKSDDLIIIHFSNSNPTGVKYKVQNNIDKVLNRFVNEGKSTISFKEPAHDLLIKADAMELRTFLKTLQLAVTKQLDYKTLGISSAASIPKKITSQKALVVTEKSKYPKTLPNMLEVLCLNNLRLNRLDKQILNLQRLCVLNLSNNRLCSIPENLNSLPCLTEIDVSHNELGSCKNWKWLGGKLVFNLLHLNLSANMLEYCPPCVIDLKKLMNLTLNNNRIKMLPNSIGGLLSLQYLNISNNELNYLPAGLNRLRLTSLDVSGNKYVPFDTQPKISPSIFELHLYELAARVVLEKRIPYGVGTLPMTIIKFLKEAAQCTCGKAAVHARGRIISPTFLFYVKPQILLQDRGQIVNMENFFCSMKCYKSFKQCYPLL